MAERVPSDDPRNAGGKMIDAGGDPHARNQVMFDTRNAVLVERFETAVAHTTLRGKPGDDAVAMVVEGRINRPPDIAGERPAEQVSHLHLMSWEAAADLVVDIQSLAARDGFDLTSLLKGKWAAAEAKGLTKPAGDSKGGGGR